MIVGIVKATIKGLVSGAVASFIGYAKKEELPKWDLKKMLQTVFVGGFTTAIVSGSGMPIPELSAKIVEWLEIEALTAPMVEFLILTGLIIIVDHLVKVIVRRSDIMMLWNKFKVFISAYV